MRTQTYSPATIWAEAADHRAPLPEQCRLKQLQLRLRAELCCILRVNGFFGHQLLAVAFQLKRFLFGNTHQPFVPLDDAVFPCNQIQAGQHQGVIGQDLKRLPG